MTTSTKEKLSTNLTTALILGNCREVTLMILCLIVLGIIIQVKLKFAFNIISHWHRIEAFYSAFTKLCHTALPLVI